MIKPPIPAADGDHGQSFSVSYLVSILLRRLWLIVLCFVAGILLTVGYLAATPSLYESTAVIQVAQQEKHAYNSADSRGNDQSDDLRSDDSLHTIEQELQLSSLFEHVVSDPGIANDKDLLPGLGFKSANVPVAEIVTRLIKQTTVKLRHGTRLIDVSVEHPVPEVAQKLANALVDEFIVDNGQAQTGAQKNVMEFLVREAERLKVNVQKSEDALQIYKEALLLKDRISDQQKALDDLTQRYREKHPKLIQARALMADLMGNFDSEIHKVMANAPSEASYWSADASHTMNGDAASRIQSELKFVEARTNVLQRECDTESALFDNVLKQMREADVSKEVAPIVVTVVEPAPLPVKPSKPRKILVMAIGSAASLVLGIGLAWLLTSLDGSFHSVEELQHFVELPILGVLPVVKPVASSAQARFPRLPVINDPGGPAAEKIRSLRASLNLLGKESERKTLLFTSAMVGEGKTFVSCNYAASLAQQGLKTLLIDADLRRPAVPGYFNLPKDQPGLTEHVALGLPLEKVMQKNVIDNLDILLSGVKNPNPAEFLSGSGFPDTLKAALLVYDRIVVDSPPTTVVSDTLLLVPHVQSVCVVIRAGQTSRKLVQRNMDLLSMAQVRPIGVVLNFLRTRWGDTYYGYGTYQYSVHKYGDSYG
jgi:polysaccharide biosynthesis transport protein